MVPIGQGTAYSIHPSKCGTSFVVASEVLNEALGLTHVIKPYDGTCVLASGNGQYVRFGEDTAASGIALSFTRTGDILVKPDGPVAPVDCDPWNCPTLFDHCDEKGLLLSGAESQSPVECNQHSPGLEPPPPSTSTRSHSPDSTTGSPTAPSSPLSSILHTHPKFPESSSFSVQARNSNHDSSLDEPAHDAKAEPGFDSDRKLD